MTTTMRMRAGQEPHQRTATVPPLPDVARALAARESAYADHAAALAALADVDDRREAALARDVTAAARALAAGKPPPKRTAEAKWAADRRDAEHIVNARDELLREAHAAFVAQLADHGEQWESGAVARAADARVLVHEAAQRLVDALGAHNQAVRCVVWIARARQDTGGALPSLGFTGALGTGAATRVVGAGGSRLPAVPLALAIAEAYAADD